MLIIIQFTDDYSWYDIASCLSSPLSAKSKAKITSPAAASSFRIGAARRRHVQNAPSFYLALARFYNVSKAMLALLTVMSAYAFQKFTSMPNYIATILLFDI